MVSENEPQFEIQLSENRNAVWIHSLQDGGTVGRFGRMGVDLHNSFTDILQGAPECRLCTHGQPTREDWETFRSRSLEWWGVEVPEDAFDPKLLKPS